VNGRPRSHSRSDAILDAALGQLALHGIAGTTVEGIAASAGAGKATVYRRWVDKESLLCAAIGQRLSTPMPVAVTDDPVSDLQDLLIRWDREFMRPHAHLWLLLKVERRRSPNLWHAFEQQVVAPLESQLWDAMRRVVCSQPGWIPDLDLAIWIAIGLLLHAETRVELATEREIDAILRLVIRQ
jgi:AcrR family transcriptional regulator